MADLVIAILSPLVEPVRKCIAAPLKRQYNYLFRFNGNMRSLRETATKLRTARRELQEQVSAAQRNGEEIFPEVLEWLKDANDIQEEEERIHNGTPAVQNAGCFTMISSRYSLSKRAVKATVEMEGLLDKGKFNSVAKPVGPSGEAPIPMTGQKHKFLSREQIQDNVVKALKDEKVNLIGVYGMGGVGKTTLAQNIGDTVIKITLAEKIGNTVMEKKMFDERAMATVSQTVDLKKIQCEIAEVLGLEKMKDVESLQERAHKLHARLTGTRRTLIILDDIWEALNLVDLGIPVGESDSGRCVVLLTSRNQDVLKLMGAQVFEVDVLPDEEAWSLFKEKAGTCVDDPALKPLAEEVAGECKGLPIALVTVGSALKDGDKAKWEDALQQLKNHIPRNLDSVLEEVYKPLRLSYDFLKDQESKTLFLLCCLFPEDFDVKLEDLTFYGMGLGTFKEVNTLHDARNRVSSIVKLLKSRSLLLDGRNMHRVRMHYVRMHDVVRDVAIFIASEKGLIDAGKKGHYPDRSCEWVLTSSNQSVDHLRGSKFSNLHLLIVHGRGGVDPYVDSSFLKGMKSLNVLCFKYVQSKLLPEAIEFSEYLRTLQFLDNHNEECLSNVGKLLNLEILICHGCLGIKELPVEIGNLKHLKLLDMLGCRNLERVAEGSISKLVDLEELKLWGSFSGWESTVGVGNEKERRNASLKELESLTKLTCLQIHISNLDLVEEEIHLPIMSLGKYKIWFGNGYLSLWDEYDKGVGFEGVVGREYNMGRWIHRLAMMAEELHFDGNIPRNFHPSEAHNTIKRLEIRSCKTLSSLTHLLENANQTASFTNLRRLYIENCYELQNLFSLESSSEDGRRSLKFQYLEKLELFFLRSLTTFVEGVASIEFPGLDTLIIRRCPKLKSLVVPVDLQNHDNECFHWFCNDQVKFGRLKNLTIDGCDEITKVWCKQIPSCFFSTLDCLYMENLNNIRGIFSSSIANNLVSLRTFTISFCKRIERVIIDEMKGESEKDEKTEYCIAFPKLKELSLKQLDTLIAFGDSGIESIIFPSLESLTIEGCPKFKYMISSLESEDGRNHDDNKCFHLLCNKKVKFDGLKILDIQGFIGNIWCEQFPVDIFKSLTELRIRNYNNVKSLFSTSMVEDLVNLQRLLVRDCEHMEKVVIDGKEINRNSTITFQNLKSLYLQNLPLLGCAFDCAIQLPLLEELTIVRCPRMKFITCNSVCTPNLKSLCVRGKYHEKEALGEVKDLNAIFVRLHEEGINF